MSHVANPFGIEALGADDVLTHTFGLFPIEGSKALQTVRKAYNDPPFKPSEFLLDLTKRGLTKLAAQARQSIEYL